MVLNATLRPRQNDCHFPDNIIFKCIFLNENVWISLKISLKFVPKVWINNIPTLVQIMAWRWPGNKPLFEQMMIRILTHMCITQLQWDAQQPWDFVFHQEVSSTLAISKSRNNTKWKYVHIYILVQHNKDYIDGLVLDCSNSTAYALELLQSCTKPLIYEKNYPNVDLRIIQVFQTYQGWGKASVLPLAPLTVHMHPQVSVLLNWLQHCINWIQHWETEGITNAICCTTQKLTNYGWALVCPESISGGCNANLVCMIICWCCA